MSEPGSETVSNDGDWKYLWEELKQRTWDPIENVPFVFYVFSGVVLFGGLGIWVEIFKIIISTRPSELSSLIAALITFFPALIGSTALQLVFASASRSDKILIAFALLALCLFLAAAIVMPFFSEAHPAPVLAVSTFCSLCAIWLWWITNGNDPTYKRIPAPDAATGGEPGRQLPGNLGDFKV